MILADQFVSQVSLLQEGPTSLITFLIKWFCKWRIRHRAHLQAPFNWFQLQRLLLVRLHLVVVFPVHQLLLVLLEQICFVCIKKTCCRLVPVLTGGHFFVDLLLSDLTQFARFSLSFTLSTIWFGSFFLQIRVQHWSRFKIIRPVSCLVHF